MGEVKPMITIGESDVESIHRLIKSKEFKLLADCTDEPSFNVFHLFQDLVKENPTSRILRFLFDSEEIHGCQDKIFRKWLRRVAPAEFYLPRARCWTRASFNWTTNSGRFIDVVVQAYDRHTTKLLFVVGIETKIDARDQANQVGDYQRSLSQTFECPTHLFYLTKNARASTTKAQEKTRCQYSRIDFSTLLPVLRSVQPPMDSMRLFFNSLIEFIEKELVYGGSMRSKAEELLDQLNKNPKHRRSIELIRNSSVHYPTSRSFMYELVLPQLQRDLDRSIQIKWHYPKTRRSPWEFDFVTDELLELMPKTSKLKALFQFVAKNQTENTTCGSTLDFQLMLYKLETKPSLRVQEAVKTLTTLMPENRSEPRQWGPWICLWGGGSHQLKDLGINDANALFNLFKNGQEDTLKIIKRNVKKLF